jgi:hypothetical protein
VTGIVGHEIAKIKSLLQGQIAVEFGTLHDLTQLLKSGLADTKVRLLDNGQKDLARH